jgi:hypothetical protein
MFPERVIVCKSGIPWQQCDIPVVKVTLQLKDQVSANIHNHLCLNSIEIVSQKSICLQNAFYLDLKSQPDIFPFPSLDGKV